QAEDGIRDLIVTGVQTCALPISSGQISQGIIGYGIDPPPARAVDVFRGLTPARFPLGATFSTSPPPSPNHDETDRDRYDDRLERSEERRVGKEWRARRRRQHGRK